MKKYMVRDNEVIYYSKSGFVTVPKTQHNYKEIIDYLMSPDFKEEKFLEMANQKEEDVRVTSKGKIKKNSDGTAKIGEINIPKEMLAKIQELKDLGYGWEHYRKFWERCLANPNPKSVELLFQYLVIHKFTITEDGCFLAYKGIRTDFKDVHSATFDNSVGNVVKMERSEVTYDPANACSKGLHCGNLAYARNWGPVVVLVKVDPANVVSVPFNSRGEKIRVCEYRVESVYEKSNPIKTAVVNKKNQPIKVRNNRGSKWTAEEEQLLRDLIAKNAKADWNKVAEKLCRSKDSCRKKWQQIKKTIPAKIEATPEKPKKKWVPLKSRSEVKESTSLSKKWTPAEELKLKKLSVSLKKDWNAISKVLGRSAGACRKKYAKLLENCSPLRKGKKK